MWNVSLRSVKKRSKVCIRWLNTLRQRTTWVGKHLRQNRRSLRSDFSMRRLSNFRKQRIVRQFQPVWSHQALSGRILAKLDVTNYAVKKSGIRWQATQLTLTLGGVHCSKRVLNSLLESSSIGYKQRPAWMLYRNFKLLAWAIVKQ